MKLTSINKSKIIWFGIIGVIALLTLIILMLYFFKPYPMKFEEEIKYASQKYDVSPSLVASVIFAESSYLPDTKSNRGAVGLMQILPSTAEWLCKKTGQNYSQELLTNPLYNIELGTYYLSYLFNKFNDVATVLASYNAGEGNVKLWLLNSLYSADGEKLSSTPFAETNAYIKKVQVAQEYYIKKYKA